MAKQLQIRGGTTVQHSTFTGALREITIDTDKDVVVVHDGTTVGGFPLAKQTSVDSKVTKVTSTDNAVVRFDGTTGEVQNSGVIIDNNNNVGIGVTPSASTIPTIQSQYNILVGQDESNVKTNSYFSGGVFKYISNGYATSYIQQKYEGSHKWQIAPSGIAGNAITWTSAMTLDSGGNLLLTSGTGALGYGIGSGGTVTQLTSKSTSVTLNKPSGRITMNNAALAMEEIVSFALNNSLISNTDSALVAIAGGFSQTKGYQVWCNVGYNGAIEINVKNIYSTSLSESIIIDFKVIKGATS